MNLFIPYSSEGSSTSILGGDRTDWIFYGQLKSTWCKWSQNLCFPQHLTSFHPIWCIGLVFFLTMNWTTTKQKPQKLTEITIISFRSDLVKYYQICDLFNPWNIWLNFHMLNSILRKSYEMINLTKISEHYTSSNRFISIRKNVSNHTHALSHETYGWTSST